MRPDERRRGKAPKPRFTRPSGISGQQQTRSTITKAAPTSTGTCVRFNWETCATRLASAFMYRQASPWCCQATSWLQESTKLIKRRGQNRPRARRQATCARCVCQTLAPAHEDDRRGRGSLRRSRRRSEQVLVSLDQGIGPAERDERGFKQRVRAEAHPAVVAEARREGREGGAPTAGEGRRGALRRRRRRARAEAAAERVGALSEGVRCARLAQRLGRGRRIDRRADRLAVEADDVHLGRDALWQQGEREQEIHEAEEGDACARKDEGLCAQKRAEGRVALHDSREKSVRLGEDAANHRSHECSSANKQAKPRENARLV
eukprot:6177827-Pleurochrysis_carterae.AAC.2